MTSDRKSATMNYVMRREKHFWIVSVLQRVQLFSLNFKIPQKYLKSLRFSWYLYIMSPTHACLSVSLKKFAVFRFNPRVKQRLYWTDTDQSKTSTVTLLHVLSA
jgi:hypothetical protein